MESTQDTLIKWSIWNIKDKDLLNLLVAREGGRTTIRIIDKILEKPFNKNQLSKNLNLDYNTITYHINIIKSHEYITEEKFDKSCFYHPSEKLFKSIKEYNLVKEYLKNDK